jgi:hypothetical protein
MATEVGFEQSGDVGRKLPIAILRYDRVCVHESADLPYRSPIPVFRKLSRQMMMTITTRLIKVTASSNRFTSIAFLSSQAW